MTMMALLLAPQDPLAELISTQDLNCLQLSCPPSKYIVYRHSTLRDMPKACLLPVEMWSTTCVAIIRPPRYMLTACLLKDLAVVELCYKTDKSIVCYIACVMSSCVIAVSLNCSF